jgi:S1-C subfamily serine protease
MSRDLILSYLNIRVPIMNKFTISFLVLVLCTLTITNKQSNADEDNAPAKWVFVEKDNISKRGCFIELSINGAYAGHGSGTLISVNDNKRHPKNRCLSEAIVVTCNHVTPERSPMISVKWQDGSKYPALVLARDSKADISILRTWVKTGTNPAPLNILPLARGTEVLCFGYGGITDVTKPRYFKAEILNHDVSDSIIVEEDVVPGDSGGGIFNKKGQLVGIIAHGNSQFRQVGDTRYTPLGQGATAAQILRLLQDYTKRQNHFYSEQ